MPVKNFIRKLIRRLQSIGRAQPASPQPRQSSGPLPTLINLLLQTYEDELTCDEFFDLLDQYAEMVQRGENAVALMPLVKRHLDLCGDCKDEYEALLRVLKASKSS